MVIEHFHEWPKGKGTVFAQLWVGNDFHCACSLTERIGSMDENRRANGSLCGLAVFEK